MSYSILLGARRVCRTLALVALIPAAITCGDNPSAPDPVATKLLIDAALSHVVAGTPISVTVALADDAGEKVADAAGSVSVAIAAGTGVAGATLSGTLTATATAGAVTFTGLSIDKAGAGYKLIVTASSLASATSGAFEVFPGAPTQIAMNAGDAQTATAGSAVAIAPSVVVKDALGNLVPATTVTFAVASGGGSIAGASQATNASGVATVTNWTLGTTMGANTLTATFTGLATPLTISATGVAGAASQMAVNAGNSQTAIAGAAVANAPSVIVKDANGNVVSGASVTFAVTSGGGTITGATQTTNANGIATIGGWTLGTTMGANALSATFTGLATPIAISATGVAGAASQVAINAGNFQTATAGAALSTKPSVIVKDANNNVVAGTSVTFAVASGGGSITGATATTGVDGIATVGSWTLGTTMGANSITAAAAGLTGSPLTISATGVAGVATQFAINAGNSQTAVAGAAVATKPSVIAKDVNGNVVSGVSITFAIASGAGAVTGSTVVTGADGVATVGSWVLGTTVGANSLTASATGLTTLTFSASGTSGTASQVAISAGNSQTAVAGSAVATKPSVIVKDANGNVVSGVSVTFAIATGGGSVASATQTTNANGVATVGNWTLGVTAGANTITATATGIAPITFTASGVAGAATQVLISAGNAQTAVAGSAVGTKPSVVAKDANGNVVSGVSITFAVATGGGSVTSATQTTNVSGVATVGNWTLGTTAGANTVTATAGALSPLTFTATGVAGNADGVSIVSGNEVTDTVGAVVSTPLSVVVKDVNGNVISGETVTFSVTFGGGSLTGTTQTTNASGIATLGSLTLATYSGTMIVSAKLSNNSGTFFTLHRTPGTPTRVILIGGSGEATVGTQVTPPTVVIQDAHFNAVPGAAVTFTVATGGGSVTEAIQTADANAQATLGSWTLGTAAGQNTLSVTVVGSTTPTLIFATGTPAAPAQIAVASGDGQTQVAGYEVSQTTFAVKDAYNNLVTGAGVTFAVVSGGGSLTGTTTTTNILGNAAVNSWTLGTTAGLNKMSATITGTSISTTISATGVAGPAGQIAIAGGNAQSVAAHATVATNPTVVVKDVNGNVVSDAILDCSARNGSVVSVNCGTTNASGIAAISWRAGDQVMVDTLIVTVSGYSLAVTFTANVVAAAAKYVNVHANASQNGTVGVAVSDAPGVYVTDAYGNPASGVTVTFAGYTSTDGSVTGGTPTTDAGGFAYVGSWILGTTAGQQTLKASVAGADDAAYFTGNAAPGTAAKIAVDDGNNQTAAVGNFVATELRVIVRDQYDNVVSNASVTLEVVTGGGNVPAPYGSQTSRSDGKATFPYWAMGTTVGAQSAKATIDGVTGPSATFSATAVAGNPQNIGWTGGTVTGIVASTVANKPSVTVTDGYGNPISGFSVTFSVHSGGGSITGATQTTNSSGVATVGSWTLGTATGANSNVVYAQGTSVSLSGAPVEIPATATAGAPATMEIVDGASQFGAAGGAVATKPSVLIKDAYGNNAAGYTVSFSVASGGGSITGGSATADFYGVATVGSWTLGSSVGSNTLSATVTGITGSLTFKGLEFGGLSAGADHACSVATDGVIYCWGHGYAGQLGGGNFQASFARPVAGNTLFTSVSAGGNTACAIAVGGAAWCWGGNSSGQVGNDGTVDTNSPSEVLGSLSFSSLAVGTYHSCGLTTAAAAYCWGSGTSGQLGDGSFTNKGHPVAVTGSHTFASIISGLAHTCALTSTGVAWCWGNGANNVLGTADAYSSDPVEVSGGLTFTKLAAGFYHMCGLTSAGAAYCWGNNGSGQLGDTATAAEGTATPVAVNGGLTFTQLVAGEQHTCGLTSAGAAYCWGDNSYNGLGNNSNASSPVPVAVSGSLTFARLSAGRGFTCGVTTAGVAYCWGSTIPVQFGVGDFQAHPVPAKVYTP